MAKDFFTEAKSELFFLFDTYVQCAIGSLFSFEKNCTITRVTLDLSWVSYTIIQDLAGDFTL